MTRTTLASIAVSEPLPPYTELCLNTPLYRNFPLVMERDASVLRLTLWGNTHLDTYCLGCKKSSTFHRTNLRREYYNDSVLFSDGITEVNYACTRDNHHVMAFFFLVRGSGSVLTKIGQYPSFADLSAGELERYRKPLGPSRFSEFNRAVGLASHGVGIGAFIYLRRIFEFLIDDAYQSAKTTTGWDEVLYLKSRVGERIQILSAYLPPFLVEHKSMYGIMSEAVHSLSEDECMTAFPVIKVAVELILDQQLEKIQREEKLAAVAKQISALKTTRSERTT